MVRLVSLRHLLCIQTRLVSKSFSASSCGAVDRINPPAPLQRNFPAGFLPELRVAELGQAARIKVKTGRGGLGKHLGIKDQLVLTGSKLWDEGHLSDAVEALGLLVQRSCFIPYTVFYRVLKRCTANRDLKLGMRVHALALRSGYESNSFLANHIIRMYASHGRFVEAMQVFSKVSAPDTFMWHSIISAYAEQGQGNMALECYRQMRKSTVKPNNYVYVAVLKGCAKAKDLASGKEVHADLSESGDEVDVFIGSCLVDMYAKCGWLDEARRVFDNLLAKNLVTWTAMISGYAERGFGQEALTVYAAMKQEGISPDNHTFACVLKACTVARALDRGKGLHAQIHGRGQEHDLVLGNCLVDMYAKCGSLEDARRVFDTLPTRDVVTWNSMLTGYVEHGFSKEALGLYPSMQQEGITSSPFTYACLLKACACSKDLQQGMQLHCAIREQGLEVDGVLGSCLVDLYAKCGSLEDARRVFDNLSTRDVVVWSAMIAGYAQHGLSIEALALYASMQKEGITLANNVTFACLLRACGSVGALHQGTQLHAQIQERGLEGDEVVGNSLVDMYVKCGKLENAREVFDRLPTRDVVTWTSLLKGYAEHGDGQMAMQCFKEMQQQGVEPDGVTFLCLLVACSHGGLVNEGQHYFKLMVEDYKIVPTVFHHSCMVDLFGRTGRLDEAENMLRTLSWTSENGVVAWTSLLSACKSHGDIERGRQCFERLIKLEPKDGTSYALLSTMYVNANRWKDAREVENLRKCAGAMKKPAKACIEVINEVHEFTVGEQREDISSKLRSVNLQLKDGQGHIPHTELVMKASSEGEKEDALCGHAEKLALAYGLLKTPDGTTLLVTKNLRMCNDCHSGTKIMSRLEKREIIVRDAHRVHHFVDGSCSCGDRH